MNYKSQVRNYKRNNYTEYHYSYYLYQDMIYERNYEFYDDNEKKDTYYDIHMYGDKNPMFGRHHTEESKKKNRESNKANWTDDKRKAFGETRKSRNNPNSRMIYQYDKNGNFIRVWDSISDASRSLNIDVSSISACARGKYKTAGGYIWKYTLDYLNN